MSTKVLLVEDDVHNLQALTIYLRLKGLEVEQARDGLEAVEKLNVGRFDVVVSDIRMPRLGGVDLAKHIRHKRAALPVVLMSGDPTASIDNMGQAEVLGVLTKPFMPGELLEIIRLSVTGREL